MPKRSMFYPTWQCMISFTEPFFARCVVDIDETEESDDDDDDDDDDNQEEEEGSRNRRRSRIPSYQRSTSASRGQRKAKGTRSQTTTRWVVLVTSYVPIFCWSVHPWLERELLDYCTNPTYHPHLFFSHTHALPPFSATKCILSLTMLATGMMQVNHDIERCEVSVYN